MVRVLTACNRRKCPSVGGAHKREGECKMKERLIGFIGGKDGRMMMRQVRERHRERAMENERWVWKVQ